MSRRIDPPVNCCTTDHSDEILRLRRIADEMSGVPVDSSTANPRAVMDWKLRYAAVKAAASLLEVHDDTGISLDDWLGVRDLVDTVLEQYELGELLENHV